MRIMPCQFLSTLSFGYNQAILTVSLKNSLDKGKTNFKLRNFIDYSFCTLYCQIYFVFWRKEKYDWKRVTGKITFLSKHRNKKT